MTALKVWDGTQWVSIDVPNGVTDHGLLAGLGDDDHPHYLLADGSRRVTGNLEVQTNSLPLFILQNTEGTNADNARASGLRMNGKKLDGTVHELGRITSEHDGSGDDIIGAMRFQVNDGGGVGAFLLVTGSDMLSFFQGEVRHTHARKINAGRTSGTQAFPASTKTAIEWVNAGRSDTGFTLGGTNGDTITVGFDGRVRIHMHCYWQLDTAPGFVEAFTQPELSGVVITRGGFISSHLSIGGTGLLGYGGGASVCEAVVTNGDTIKVHTTVNAGGALDLLAGYSGIVVERIQGND